MQTAYNHKEIFYLICRNLIVLYLVIFFSLSFLCAVEGTLGPGMSPSFKLSHVCVHSHLHRQTSMAWAVSFPFLSTVPNVSSSLTTISLPCEVTKQLIRNCSLLPFGTPVNLTHKMLFRARYEVGVLHSLLKKKDKLYCALLMYYREQRLLQCLVNSSSWKTLYFSICFPDALIPVFNQQSGFKTPLSPVRALILAFIHHYWDRFLTTSYWLMHEILQTP